MDRRSFERYCAGISGAPFVVVDTETTINTPERTSPGSLYDGRDWTMGIGVAFEYTGALLSGYFPFRHESDNLPIEWLRELKEYLEPKPLVFHNAKFDLAALTTCGIEPRGEIFDTIVMAHMVNEEYPSKELDWLAKYILHDEKNDDQLLVWKKHFGWNSIPPKLMGPYCCHDCELTYKLFKIFWKEMQP